jgi:hypothetical protein
VGHVVRIPPPDLDWTAWERVLLEQTLSALLVDGLDITRYEWRTPEEVWCSFRLRKGRVIAEIGRVQRAYVLKWPDAGKLILTFDLACAVKLVPKAWSSHSVRVAPPASPA